MAGSKLVVRKDEEQSSVVAWSADDRQGAAQLLKSWGTVGDLSLDDTQKVVDVALACGMNPIFDLDMLGGKFYDKADFWLSELNRAPVVEYVESYPIKPGSDAWDLYMGPTDPEMVAAAVVTVVKRVDRSRPIESFNYVMRDDAILGEWSKPEWFNKDEAEEANARVKELRAEGKRVDKFSTSKGYGVKFYKTRDDWYPLAVKKAETTSARRAAKRTIPRKHAQVMQGINQMEGVVEQRQAGIEGVVSHSDDPFGDPDSQDAQPSRLEQKALGKGPATSEALGLLGNLAREQGFGKQKLTTFARKALGIPEGQEFALTDLRMHEVKQITDALDSMGDGEVQG